MEHNLLWHNKWRHLQLQNSAMVTTVTKGKRERFRSSDCLLKSMTTEEHNNLSIKSNSVLRT